MQAVIMAGGKGTRLSSVITDIPKPMVPINGKPLLEYQVENLKEAGVTDIIIVVGYLGHVIQNYFKDGKKYGLKITYFIEEMPLGTAGALKYLKKQLKDNFLLVFGDLFININFERFYKYHIEKKGLATLYAHPNSHPHDSDILIVNNEKRVLEWSYKNSIREKEYKNLVNAGVYVLNKDLLQYIPDIQKVDLEKHILGPNLEKIPVYAYSCTEYVKDIGTPERLYKVEKDLSNGVCKQRNLKNKQKCIFLDRDGTINCHVGFLRQPEQLNLEINVAKAIQKINESEYLAVVVSNQPVIARGECSFETMEKIHNRLETLLGKEGAYLDDIYYCPHHTDKGFEGEIPELKYDCNCRKPKIGMLEKAAGEHNIDLSQSWIIGDTTVDIMTGKNAKMRTALILTGEAGKDKKFDVTPDIVGNDLLNCLQQILKF